MKTTQGNAIKAYILLQRIGNEPKNKALLFKLFRLKKALKEIIDFQSEQEEKLIKECNGTFDENGRASFESDEDKRKYYEEHKELEKLECEIDLEKAEVDVNDFDGLTLDIMEIFDPFFEFKG